MVWGFARACEGGQRYEWQRCRPYPLSENEYVTSPPHTTRSYLQAPVPTFQVAVTPSSPTSFCPYLQHPGHFHPYPPPTHRPHSPSFIPAVPSAPP